jgi:hypothetical protein
MKYLFSKVGHLVDHFNAKTASIWSQACSVRYFVVQMRIGAFSVYICKEKKICFRIRPQEELGMQVANPQVSKERLCPHIANPHIAKFAKGPQI